MRIQFWTSVDRPLFQVIIAMAAPWQHPYFRSSSPWQHPYLRSSSSLLELVKWKNFTPFVTRSEKRDHFAQEFKIELLVLKGRVALKYMRSIFCRESNALRSFSH